MFGVFVFAVTVILCVILTLPLHFENRPLQQNDNFQLICFLLFAQLEDSGYTFEPTINILEQIKMDTPVRQSGVIYKRN